MARQRRKFTKEFKLETVKLVKEGPRSISQIARDLDLTESALRNWIRQYDIDTGNREGTTTAERLEQQQLRAEVRQLRMEREILKKATACFAKESPPVVSGPGADVPRVSEHRRTGARWFKSRPVNMPRRITSACCRVMASNAP